MYEGQIHIIMFVGYSPSFILGYVRKTVSNSQFVTEMITHRLKGHKVKETDSHTLFFAFLEMSFI